MKKHLYRDLFILTVIVLGLALLMFQTSYSQAPEIKKILSLKNIPEQSEELLKLLNRAGPMEAQEEMLRSGLPFTGETHLLVHTIGDYVYDKYGIEGLPYCRDYFLSACYHGFIINTLGDNGLTGMVEVMKKCFQAGNSVAVQCAHAAGHGFLAWHDYDLIKALKMCDELGEKVANFGRFNCYDGVFMENMWGVHDGAPSEKRWVKEDDIYYPCNEPRIPEKYLGGCWTNQASLIYQYYQGDLRKTALACDAVENEAYRDICYNNFARQIHPLTAGNKVKVAELCSYATGEDRKNECILTNMVAYWSVGDRQTPYKICNYLSGQLKESCFDRLIGMINYSYGKSPQEKEAYCDKISDKTFREQCKS